MPCHYCGRPIWRDVACYAHRDLPHLDPVYGPFVRKQKPAEASLPDVLLDRLPTRRSLLHA